MDEGLLRVSIHYFVLQARTAFTHWPSANHFSEYLEVLAFWEDLGVRFFQILQHLLALQGIRNCVEDTGFPSSADDSAAITGFPGALADSYGGEMATGHILSPRNCNNPASVLVLAGNRDIAIISDDDELTCKAMENG